MFICFVLPEVTSISFPHFQIDRVGRAFDDGPCSVHEARVDGQMRPVCFVLDHERNMFECLF